MVSKHSGIRGIFDTILVNRYKNLYKCCVAMDREHELKFKWKKVEKKNTIKKKGMNIENTYDLTGRGSVSWKRMGGETYGWVAGTGRIRQPGSVFRRF